ncbi:MAG: protein translocase subunit SecF [Patescibacteria group bacterium]
MKSFIVKYRYAWYSLSAAMILASFVGLGAYGLKQGIDFTGGSILAVRFEQRPSITDTDAALRDAVKDLGAVVIQPAGDSDIQIRTRALTEDEHSAVTAKLTQSFGTSTELRFDAIGPVIGKELRDKSMKGLAITLVLILAYIAWAFRKVSGVVKSWQYGAVTIFAAFHDVIVPMGVFAFLGHFRGDEVGTPFVAAILTILGYSITDTIVVLDRVRENLQVRDGSFAEIVEASVQQTILRSFNTSATTLLTLLAIYFFGGMSLHDFTLTLIIGIAVGTYSSIFVAAPMLVTLDKWARRAK